MAVVTTAVVDSYERSNSSGLLLTGFGKLCSRCKESVRFSIHLHLLDLVVEVKDVGVVEWHVVTITSKHDQVVLEDDASMAVSGRGPLALNVENLIAIVPSEHGGAFCHAHVPAHVLPLAHLVVVRVEVAGVVVLDQKRALHVVRSR